jgi:uncharacterized protein YeeX (DUF496 family)
MQKFYKGRTNNHLTWVMVDATDFATPESALSAATKIKVYGKLRSATGVNFVSSGTGSLTNDIQHVGASVTGIYTIALAKADLSDASAAWYDQYIVNLSATGAAYQTLIIDGGIDESSFSDILSNAYSAAAQANSRVLLVLSNVSDVQSALTVVQSIVSDIRSHVSDLQSDFQSRVPKAVATNSQLSDLHSDLRSVLIVMSGVISDTHSLVSSAATTSDVVSAIEVAINSRLSDILSAAQQGNSRVLVVQSMVSDVDSALTSRFSDLQSLVTTTGVQLNASVMSDLRSAVAAVTVNLTASDISDIASAVAAAVTTITASDISDIASRVDAVLASRLSDILSAAQQTNSRVLLVQSHASDIYSLLSDVQSDFQSRVPKRVATDSQLSALTSDVLSAVAAGGISASDVSDIASAVVVVLASNLSDILSAAQQTNSRVLLNQSRVSDIYSLLSDLHSDVGVLSGVVSDVSSAVNALPTVSDIASTVLSAAAVNPIHANIHEINDVSLVGDGSGTPWGPA